MKKVRLLNTFFKDYLKLFLYGLCVIGANLIQGIIILPLILKIKKRSPLKVFKAMMPALSMAFFSKSSNGTLPLTLECAQNRLKLSEKTSKFSLPLFSVINNERMRSLYSYHGAFRLY